MSSKNKSVKYLLCVIDVFTKYAWVNPLKDKRCKTVLNAFIKKLNKSNCKQNKSVMKGVKKQKKLKSIMIANLILVVRKN